MLIATAAPLRPTAGHGGPYLAEGVALLVGELEGALVGVLAGVGDAVS
jgi:hypothetical protein